jgi:hypothetical protein
MRLRTSIQEMPKRRTLTPMPLASTKMGRLLSALLLKASKVAKYRLHGRPAISLRLCSEKRGWYFASPARCTPSSS